MSSTTNQQPQFSKLRQIFFPVYLFELKKVLPMAAIFFFILYDYTCFRNIKDSLIVPNCGAEALSFLKFWCVTPSAFLFMILYVKASSIFSREKLFYVTILPFIVFFAAFILVLYPLRDVIHPSKETVDSLITAYPSLKYLFSLWGSWSYGLFYVLAEIWGSAILSLLFWQFANQITRMNEAKRFYAFFGMSAQFALLLSGGMGQYFSEMTKQYPEAFQVSLNWQIGLAVVFGMLIVGLYRWMHVSVLTDKRFYDEAELANKPKKKKMKMGLLDSLKTIATTPYLGLIVALVIAYGTSINFVEAVWKAQIKIAHPDPNNFNIFMNKVTFWTGIVSILMMVVGGNILRMFRWFTAAVITPTVMLLLGGIFFALVLFNKHFIDLLTQIGTTPVGLAMFTGAIVVIITKSTKYALFDLTKEMAYIPLDDEMKVKGKAVVDVVGGRLGKSAGAGFQQFLFMIVFPGSTLLGIAPTVAVSFLIVCAIWIVSVKALSKKVDHAVAEREKEHAAAAAAAAAK